MEMIPMWVAGLGWMLTILVGIAGTHSAYRNGVNDGYMYTKDPSCPGYRKAERILKSYGKI